VGGAAVVNELVEKGNGWPFALAVILMSQQNFVLLVSILLGACLSALDH